MYRLEQDRQRPETIEFEKLPCLEILKDLGIDPYKYLGGTSLKLTMPPDYFDVSFISIKMHSSFISKSKF